MAQNPLAATVAVKSGKQVSVAAGPGNEQYIAAGGQASALNQTAAAVIKATPGTLHKLVIVAGGTASNGAFTLNDCATTGTAAAANEIITIPSGATAGTVINLDWPCLTGIVLSAVPSAGSPIIALSYT